MADQAHASRDETSKNIQANLLKASKFQVGKEEKVPRNWSLFFFFRILPQAEFDATLLRLGGARDTSVDNTDAKRDLWRDFADPALMNAGLVDQRLADVGTPKLDAPPSSPDAPPSSPGASPSLPGAPPSKRKPDRCAAVASTPSSPQRSDGMRIRAAPSERWTLQPPRGHRGGRMEAHSAHRTGKGGRPA